MKTMKIKAASMAIALTALTFSAIAQPQQRGPQRGGEVKTPEKMAEIATDKLDQRLDLSDSQESKILKINLKYAKLQAEQREEREPRAERPTADSERPSQEDRKAMMEDRKAMMTKMKEQKRAHQLEIMALLDDGQKLDYAAIVAKPNKGRGQGQQPGAQRGPKPQSGEMGQGRQGGNDKAPKGDGRQGGEMSRDK